jgi:hypothetical protein
MRKPVTMKFFLRLFFILIPVFANAQTQPGTDSLVLPSVTRDWTAAEFQEVFKYILSKQKDNSTFICFDDNKPLFAKLIDIKSYWFLESKDIAVNERIPLNLAMVGYIQKIFLNYYQKSRIINGKLKYEKEGGVFYCLLLEIAENQITLTDEFIKTHANLTSVQLDGMKQMNQGILSSVAGTLTTLEKEYTYFSDASICSIAKIFRGFYSTAYNRIDAASKTEFDKRIAIIIKQHPLPCIRTALQKAPAKQLMPDEKTHNKDTKST